MLVEEFGRRLKYWRKKRGLFQRELAEKAGVSGNAVSYFERGVNFPTLMTAELLLDALNVDIGTFFEEEIS